MFYKIYIGQSKEFLYCKFDKKSIFATGSENLTHKLKLIWNSPYDLKKLSL